MPITRPDSRIHFLKHDLPPVALHHYARFWCLHITPSCNAWKRSPNCPTPATTRYSRTQFPNPASLVLPWKMMLVALTLRLKTQTRRFHEAVFLVQPDTLLKWHRELVCQKWIFQHAIRGGQPKLEPDMEQLARCPHCSWEFTDGVRQDPRRLVETEFQDQCQYRQERFTPP